MKVYTKIEMKDISNFEKQLKNEKINPRDLKIFLASAIVERYHGKQASNGELLWFNETFSKKRFPDDAKIIILGKEKLTLIELLTTVLKNRSKSEIKKLITHGAVKFNDKKIEELLFQVNLNNKKTINLQVGKKNFFKLMKMTDKKIIN